MSSPTFFTDGSTPRPNATQWTILQKILGASVDGGSGGGGLSGSGSPEGAITANPGATYWDAAGLHFWVKNTGSDNTGWAEIV